jgi:hypothetical protein
MARTVRTGVRITETASEFESFYEIAKITAAGESDRRADIQVYSRTNLEEHEREADELDTRWPDGGPKRYEPEQA